MPLIGHRLFNQKLSPAFNKALAVVCLLICPGLGLWFWVTGDQTVLVAVLMVGLPALLLGLSLLFGKASKGLGVLSPLTLCLLASMFILLSLVGIMAGHPRSGMGLVLAVACVILASKRSRKKRFTVRR